MAWSDSFSSGGAGADDFWEATGAIGRLGCRPIRRSFRPRRWLSVANVATASSTSGRSNRARTSIACGISLCNASRSSRRHLAKRRGGGDAEASSCRSSAWTMRLPDNVCTSHTPSTCSASSAVGAPALASPASQAVPHWSSASDFEAVSSCRTNSSIEAAMASSSPAGSAVSTEAASQRTWDLRRTIQQPCCTSCSHSSMSPSAALAGCACFIRRNGADRASSWRRTMCQSCASSLFCTAPRWEFHAALSSALVLCTSACKPATSESHSLGRSSTSREKRSSSSLPCRSAL
mmetsp:Transcript_121033/g.342882  ORF Transcript_121033/g.342882 Transcript_121033/m.342882 type:complete len:292 (-) Transcript_121033:1277-2152(-)